MMQINPRLWITFGLLLEDMLVGIATLVLCTRLPLGCNSSSNRRNNIIMGKKYILRFYLVYERQQIVLIRLFLSLTF